jgi:hypothetical protein
MRKIVVSVVGCVCVGLVGCMAAPEDDAQVAASRSALSESITPQEVLPPVTDPPIVPAKCNPGLPPLSPVKGHAFCGMYTDGCGNVQTVQCPKGSGTYCVENACYPLPSGGAFCTEECPPGTGCDPATLQCVPLHL